MERLRTMNFDQNRLRAFADVVSVDAWHEAFSSDKREVDLKVDVVFSEGRVGGEDDSLVQFRQRLRRATLIVITPETEPVGIVRESIRREQADEVSEWSAEKVRKTGLLAEGGIEASISAKGASGGGHAKLGAKMEAAHTYRETAHGKNQPMKTMFRYDNIDETYTWVIEGDTSEYLYGRAWD
ncbi:Hypothetical protein, partial CDS, partial [Neorhizobium galegae bv. officinalis]